MSMGWTEEAGYAPREQTTRARKPRDPAKIVALKDCKQADVVCIKGREFLLAWWCGKSWAALYPARDKFPFKDGSNLDYFPPGERCTAVSLVP